MKKGDIRKQEILETAEQFFCRKGYEQTSVQDIIDKLNTSKGSFYHHYASKQALLEGICQRRAESIGIPAPEKNAEDTGLTVIQRLNKVLSGMVPLNDEKLSFLIMILHIFLLPEGKSVKNAYCEALKKRFLERTVQLLNDGNGNGELFCTAPDLMADICLSLVNQLWTQICEMIITAEEACSEADISEMLRLTDQYRMIIERGLCMPFGSLELISLSSLKYLYSQIHMHWNE